MLRSLGRLISWVTKGEEIIETLGRLALAMETLGRNYISIDEYRKDCA